MSKYWKARQEKRENLSFDKGTEAYKEYIKTLEQAKENINSKIAKLYAKHSEDTGLAKAESMKIIQGKEYKEWRYKIEDYVKQLNSIKDRNSIEFKKLSLELETLVSRSRINRLESLKADIDMELIRSGVKANDTMSNALTKTYADTYKSLIDDLNYKSTVDMDRMKKVIGYDWSGANYSKRIWGNTESLAKTIKNEVLVGLNQGINYKTMSTRIANKFEISKKNAERLVRTEINYIHNQATVDSYKDAGVEKYQFLATLDSRTSQTCASLNGEVFEVKNIAVGINYPPMHPRCFDKNTELYTSNGWKYFKDLSKDDKVYTINTNTLESEWQLPINYIKYKYTGDMIHYKNSRFDLMVTPNHNILVQNMDTTVKNKSWKLKEASKVGRKSKHRMLAGQKWAGQNKKYEYLANEKVDIETYLKFMAYWLADGSCTLDRESYNIKIAQYNNDWMYEDLKAFPFKIYKCKESLMIHNKKLGIELSKYGKCTEKYIPENIKNMSSELIRLFLLAYSKTDGTVRKGKFWKGYQFNDTISFFTSSDKLAGDLGELILKAGGRPSFYLDKCSGTEVKFRNGVYTINKDVWVINWNTQIHNYLYNMEIKDVKYNDYVYCVEVPLYNTLLVRRHGKVCWSGNCRSTTVPIIDYASLANMSEKDFEEKEEGAIMRYIGAESYLLNDALRNNLELTTEQKEWIKDLDQALTKYPKYEGIVSRSIDFRGRPTELEKFLNEHIVGDVKEYSAYISATTGETYNPDGVIQIQIVSKSGRDIRKLNSGEQEILFERKKKFIIIKKIKINNKYYFDMEEVDE